ncbi:MAG: hypothetical protein NVSMB30_21130 [Hymenobacter sp.]
MLQVKADGGHPRGPLVEQGGRKVVQGGGELFAGLQQRVGHGLHQRRQAGQGAPEPYFEGVGRGHKEQGETMSGLWVYYLLAMHPRHRGGTYFCNYVRY